MRTEYKCTWYYFRPVSKGEQRAGVRSCGNRAYVQDYTGGAWCPICDEAIWLVQLAGCRRVGSDAQSDLYRLVE